MLTNLQVRMMTYEKTIFSGSCHHVVLPGAYGKVAIYPNKAPFLVSLKKGPIVLHAIQEGKLEGNQLSSIPLQIIHVSGGVSEIKEGTLTILIDDILDEEEKEITDLQDEEAK